MSKDFEDYLKEQIRYWENLRQTAWPDINNPELEARYYHGVWSASAQVLLSALWEYRGERSPTMGEIMAES